MHHIGIDVRMARHTGIGRYIGGFVPALNHSRFDWQYHLFGKHELKQDFPQWNFIRFDASVYGLSEQFQLPILAHFCDVLHVPHYNIPIFWNKKLVITIHDLIHLEFSKDLNPFASAYSKMMLPLATKKANAIIAVSEKTKIDLIEKLNVPAQKITVIHHGIDPLFLSDHDSLPNKGMSDLYFLYVGLIKSHKNLGILLQAFTHLRKKLGLDNLKLRIVGKPDKKQKIVREWLYLVAGEPTISIESGLNDEELKSAYSNAVALIFPSLYEGFGFPLIEAMACKTPIIAARATSIPEVAGEEAALYFDPYSSSELENQMEKLMVDSELRKKLIEAGLKRAKSFNWKNSAEQTERVYESVINQ